MRAIMYVQTLYYETICSEQLLDSYMRLSYFVRGQEKASSEHISFYAFAFNSQMSIPKGAQGEMNTHTLFML